MLFPHRSTKEPTAHFKDNLTTSPDKYKSVYCGICNVKMDESRGVIHKDVCGSVSSRQYKAAGSPTTTHDEYECPNRSYDWHKKVYNLCLANQHEASDTIKQIRENEILSVLQGQNLTP